MTNGNHGRRGGGGRGGGRRGGGGWNKSQGGDRRNKVVAIDTSDPVQNMFGQISKVLDADITRGRGLANSAETSLLRVKGSSFVSTGSSQMRIRWLCLKKLKAGSRK